MIVVTLILTALVSWVNPALAQTNPSPEAINRVVARHPLVIAVNSSTEGPGAQTLTIYEHGVLTLTAPVSTGKPRDQRDPLSMVTATGFFRPTRLFRRYRSRQFDEILSHAVFFYGGFAIHAASNKQVPKLGKRVSHGCVRVHPDLAQLIQTKIMEQGKGSAPGQFGLYKVKDDIQIKNNTITLNPLHRAAGLRYINQRIESWDAVIVVYRR